MNIFVSFLKGNCLLKVRRSLQAYCKKYEEKYMIMKVSRLQKKALSRLKDKETIRCVFFVSELGDWKCDNVYKQMLEHPRFNPVALICPVFMHGNEMMIKDMEQLVHFFKSKGYNYRMAYDMEKHIFIDIRKDLTPDFIFYTTPYINLTDERFFITNYLDILGAYIPYGYNNNSEMQFSYNLLFHNLLWRYYVESESHKKYSENTSRNKGRNCVVTGYPAIEGLIDNHTPAYDSWKVADRKLKRIIWAPHHTIEPEGNVSYSCFLDYADYMVELAKKYKDSVQFVFKPHPLLKTKLEKIWGKSKTELYFHSWQEMPNTSIVDGDYIDLFLTSDAMIHDSGSFIVEYLYVNKPVLRTLNELPLDKLYNSFVLKCLDCYYFARNNNDIDRFIQNVINNVDSKKEQRTKFVNDMLMPKDFPSRIIINDILHSIDNQILYRN